jgi:hypothetical protein
LAFSTPSDLEVLKLTHNIIGISSFELEFFTDIFMSLFLSKDRPFEKDNKIEDKIAVYTDKLSEFLKKKKGNPSPQMQ